jgi:hypothetical protein
MIVARPAIFQMLFLLLFFLGDYTCWCCWSSKQHYLFTWLCFDADT